MKKEILVAVSIVALIIIGCTSKKEVLKRYKTAKYQTWPTNTTPKVGVTTYAFPVEKTPDDKNLLNLADRGQAALITAIAAKEKDSKGILEGISGDLRPAKEQSKIVDKTKFKRKIVLSATNLSDSIGDRIVKLKIKLQSADSTTIEFKGWNQITSQFQTIDVGKATYGRTSNLTISPELTVGENSGKLGSFSNQISIGQEANLRQRIVVLSGSLTRGTAVLFQEGFDGQDLSGNIIADIDLEFTNVATTELFTFDKLYTVKKVARIDSLSISSYILRSPNHTAAVTATLSYDYLFRKIKNGAESITESDDDIILIKQQKNAVQTFTVLGISDYKPKTWSIRIPGAGGGLVQVRRNGFTSATILSFDSYSEAEKVMLWLKATVNPTINGHQFQMNGTNLTNGQYPLLEVVLN